MHDKLREHFLKSKPEDIPNREMSEIAGIFGMDVAIKLMDIFGGSSVYIPMLSEFKPAIRSFVKKEFNGKNKLSLAHICNCSVRSIEKIISDDPKPSSDREPQMQLSLSLNSKTAALNLP